jgi:hypothetical protein
MARPYLQFSRVAYGAAVVAIFAWAAWRRFSVPLEPIADPDTWGYLLPALGRLAGPGFTHAGRNFVYPGFLYLLLRLAGDFRAIVVAQHVLGLGAGALMLGTWLRVRQLARPPALSETVHCWIGLVPVAIYLFAADTVRVEMQIRPEGVCGFLGMLNVFLVVRFCEVFFLRGNQRAASRCAVALIFGVVLFGSVRPSFWLPALSSLVPVSFFLFRPGATGKIAVACGAIGTVMLLIVPERLLARGDEVDASFVPTLLFAQHADIIRDQIANDLADNSALPYSREFLQRYHFFLGKEIKRSLQSGRPYPSLGFDPEYLMYDPESIDQQLRREFGDDVDKLCDFYRFYYRRAFLHQPGRMLAKVARQIGIFYRPRSGAYNWARSIDLQADYAASLEELKKFPDRLADYGPATAFVKQSAALADTPVRIEQGGYIRYPLYSLSKRYVSCLFAAVVTAALVFFRPDFRQRWGWLVGAVLFLYWYSFATCFETALVNSLEVFRYVTVQLAFVVLAQFMTLLLLFELLTGAVVSWRRNRDPAA